MEKEHDWLLIGSELDALNDVRMFLYRCKWCLAKDMSFALDGPPSKRHMMDKCKHE